MLRGLIERVWLVKRKNGTFGPPPVAKPKCLHKVRRYTDRIIKLVPPSRKLSSSEFVAQCAPTKVKLYEQALQSDLRTRGVTARDAWIKVFIKAEKVALTKKKPDPAPRLIQPRTPKYNLRLGCYTRAIEHDVYQAIDRIWSEKNGSSSLKTVMKGMNCEEMGQAVHDAWMHMSRRSRSGRVVAVGFDAARWDQHVGVCALKEEHRVYNTIFKSDELAWLLRQQLDTYGRGWVVQPDKTEEHNYEYKVSYRRKGGRCSGDMNTGLGNVLLACCIMATTLEKYQCHLINNGDDCVVFFTQESYKKFDLERFQNDWTDMGFTMEKESEAYCLEEVLFCRMHPINVNGTWRMVRELSSLEKDMYIVGRDSSSIESWLHCVGLGGLAACAGVPIHQALYASLPRLDESNNYWNSNTMSQKLKWMSAGMPTGSGEIVPSMETRLSYWRGMGVPPDDQLYFEDRLRRMARGPDLGHQEEVEFEDNRKNKQWLLQWGQHQ